MTALTEASPRINPDDWGQDHWRTFLYVETCCVDKGGVVDPRRVQTNHSRHPVRGNPLDGSSYGIRLKDRTLPGEDYDEWDCIEDMEHHGLLENDGTDNNPRYRLTAIGKSIAGQLRGHLSDGASCKTFTPSWPKD